MPPSGPIHAFDDTVWLSHEPVVHLGLRLTSTMTVIRLRDGGLLLYSPVPMTRERRDAVAALGPITHLFAPNTYHHRWIGEWADANPSAKVHAPAGLARKRRDLRIDRHHSAAAEAPEPAFAGTVEELPIAGCLLAETVLYVPAARTLVVADLVHNIGRPEHGWTRLYARAMGFYDRVALSRMLRTAFRDPLAARRSLDTVLTRPFDRLIPGHGAPIIGAARDALATAYSWLPAA